jgi:hypothetical protein
VKRKAVIFQTSSDGKRSVAVDATNALTILAYITQDARHEKKFRHIVELILNGLRNTELYDKENINDKTGNVTAMKLFKGQENDRIYCQEFTTGDKTFVVVAAELRERKKSQKNKHTEINLIQTVASYEYELEDEPTDSDDPADSGSV